MQVGQEEDTLDVFLRKQLDLYQTIKQENDPAKSELLSDTKQSSAHYLEELYSTGQISSIGYFLGQELIEEAKDNDNCVPSDLKSQIVEKLADIYTTLYDDCSLVKGKELSKNERCKRGLEEEKCFIYGEIEYNSFIKILHQVLDLIWLSDNAVIREKYRNSQLEFCDLGSGTGRAVMIASLQGRFSKCRGIEYLETLVEESKKVEAKYDELTDKLQFGSSQNQDGIETPIVQIDQGSFLELEWWEDTDIAFANSTCFDDQLMKKIALKAEEMQIDSFFISFTRQLPSEQFIVVEKTRYRMSWGPATIFIHQKIK